MNPGVKGMKCDTKRTLLQPGMVLAENAATMKNQFFFLKFLIVSPIFNQVFGCFPAIISHHSIQDKPSTLGGVYA